ncbi:hypothetical protein Tco_1494338 [Tanacetum coccineum]
MFQSRRTAVLRKQTNMILWIANKGKLILNNEQCPPESQNSDEIIMNIHLRIQHSRLLPQYMGCITKVKEEKKPVENVKLVNKHLASEEIEKMVEGSENVIDDSLPHRNDEPQIPGTRLKPKSDKESLKVEITNDEERREKGKIIEEFRITPFPTPIRSPRTHTNLVSSDTGKLQELTVPKTTCRSSAVRPRDQDDPHDDAHPEGENSNQEQVDDYDFWTDSYASDDDEIPTKQVSQDIMEEEIVVKRANECIASITEPDYKNLNKNDVDDMYLLIMNGRELTANEVEYLKLFEEEIEVRLKYRNQMRRWEMYVKGGIGLLCEDSENVTKEAGATIVTDADDIILK